MAKQFLIEANGSALLRADTLRRLPLAAARRLVRYALERVKGDLLGIDFGHIAAILNLASSGAGHGRAQAPGVDAERSLDWVRLEPSGTAKGSPGGYRFPVPVPGLVRIPGTVTAISLEMIEIAETVEASDCVYNEETGCLDWPTLSGSLEIRSWRPGDRYRPKGSAGEEKIKTLFQKARIPRWERRHWPIITDGEAIVWARQFGAAEAFAARPASERVLRVREL
jgi:tRNA(Ile)-lysidine synthase